MRWFGLGKNAKLNVSKCETMPLLTIKEGCDPVK